MSALSRLRSWWRARRDPGALDRQLREELEFHADRCAEDLVRGGLSPDKARQRARAALGSLPATGENVRAALGLRLGDEIRGDLRYALRGLRRSPGFAAVAILSLGLGIGANTAIFSLVDTVLLKPLPVPRPDRLFFVDSSGGRSGQSGPPYPAFEIMRERNRHFSALAAVSGTPFFRVTIDGATEFIRGAHASGQFFDVLQLTASRGRLFTAADDAQIGVGGRDGAVAVISDALWRRRFAGDPGALGRTIEVDTRPVTIVGILPPRFQGLEAGFRFDVIVPFALAPNERLRARESWWFQAIGRLKDDATVAQAQAELNAFWQAYLDDNRVSEGTRRGFPSIVLTSARRGLNDLRRDFAEPLWIVMAIVGLVLAIGCANVASLLVARASARHREIALRRAIGAGAGRLLRQMLVEGLLLSALGSVLGLGVAAAGVRVLVGVFAGAHERVLLEPTFDLRLLGFTAVVAVLTGVFFSLVPAIHALRRAPSGLLRDDGRTTQSAVRLRAGQVLVALQVALSIVLLFGAALFVRTLINLKSVDTGFTAAGVTTVAVDTVLGPAVPPEQAVAERASVGQMWQGLADRVSALPGVESAAVAALTPFTGWVRGIGLVVVGPAVQAKGGIRLNQITPTYFDTFGMRIVRGRPFLPADRAGSANVVILNETAARYHFGDTDPVGRRVRLPKPGESGDYEVVGVVADARYESLRVPVERMAYVPLAQAFDRIGRSVLAVRASADMATIVPSIRREIREHVPGGLVGGITSVSREVDDAMLQERLVSLLAAVFGVLALILACIGLYGVLAYTVVRRTREIGIRVAVGARAAAVVWLVLRETVVVAACGVAIGLPAALWTSRFAERQFFDVTSHDPLALAGTVLSLMAVAVIAAIIPARRASRIDPIHALRSE